MKSNNIILIGMPGSGKSTLGVQLAKALNVNFVDTDLLIQRKQGKSLQSILDQQGYQALRQIEAEELLQLQPENDLIATGGSAVYSDQAMQHLGQKGLVVYLRVSLPEIKKRIANINTRGIARPSKQSLEAVYAERIPLYEQYADLIIDNEKEANIDTLANQIDRHLKEAIPSQHIKKLH